MPWSTLVSGVEVGSVGQQLRYLSDKAASSLPLPPWAAVMAGLGDALAKIDPQERRLVVGVTLPARGYAAALATAAHVIRRNQLDPMEPSDADLHFEILRAQPEGTPVRLLQGGRVHD